MTARTAGGRSSTSATSASATNSSRWIAALRSLGWDAGVPTSALLMVSSLSGTGRQRRSLRELAVGSLHGRRGGVERRLDGDCVFALGHDVGRLPDLAAEVGCEVMAGELVRRPPQCLAGDDRVVAGAPADARAQIMCRAAGQQDPAQDRPERLG